MNPGSVTKFWNNLICKIDLRGFQQKPKINDFLPASVCDGVWDRLFNRPRFPPVFHKRKKDLVNP